MALSDRVKNPPSAKLPGPRCSVGALLETLEGDELEALRVMLGTREQPGWTANEVYDAITAEGYTVGRQTISRHRGGRCSCASDAA
jgi:hypothetical protein